jgi:hypothetical protein
MRNKCSLYYCTIIIYHVHDHTYTSPRDHILHGSLHIIQLALHLDEFLAKLCYLLLQRILLKLCSICALALQLDVRLRLCVHVCLHDGQIESENNL